MTKNTVKFAFCDDLHLEFGPLDSPLKNTENADVLILAGDICVASSFIEKNELVPNRRSDVIHDFFENVSKEFEKVIYIAGNHEHYHGDFAKTETHLKAMFAEYYPNVHFMENEHLIINDVVFFAGTLWTDMNKEDPITMSQIRRMMNDYVQISNSTEVENGAFYPIDTVNQHKKYLAELDKTLKLYPTSKFVCVGHHAPSKLSTKPQYEKEVLMNGAYSSDLNEIMLDNPNIKFWGHGHCHSDFDFLVGSTRIVCNPRGYHGYEAIADDFQLKFFEV